MPALSLRGGGKMHPRLESKVDRRSAGPVGRGEIAPRRAHHTVSANARVVRSDAALFDLRCEARDLAVADDNFAARQNESNWQADRHARSQELLNFQSDFGALRVHDLEQSRRGHVRADDVAWVNAA